VRTKEAFDTLSCLVIFRCRLTIIDLENKLNDFGYRSKAIKYDPRFARLAYWTELQDKGLLNVRTIKNDDGKIIRLKLWLTQYFADTGVSSLISDWDADQYEIVKTDDVYLSAIMRHALKQEVA